MKINYFKELLKKDYLFLVFIVILNLIIHIRVFFSGHLSAGDWPYINNSALSQFKDQTIWLSYDGLGSYLSFPNNNFFYWTSSFLYNFLNLDWDWFTKFFFLLPIIILTPVFTYLFFLKITNNKNVGIFATSFYIFNTFTLKLYLDWITYLYCWWLLPAMLYFVLRFKESKNYNYFYYLIILNFINIFIEIRIGLINFAFILFFSSLYNLNKSNIKENLFFVFKIFMSIFFGFLLHLNWILSLFTKTTSHLSDLASGSQFGSFYHLSDLFSLNYYGWYNNLVQEAFVRQVISPRTYLITFFVIFGIFISYLKDKKNYFLLFFTFLVLLFIGKQSRLPFSESYEWFFENIPLFNIYRESSKFYIILAIPLAYFFAQGLNNFNFSIFKNFYIKVCLVFLVLIFNTQNFITGKFGGMSVTVEMPSDYVVIKQLIEKDNSFFRSFWMTGFDRWSFGDNLRPVLLNYHLEKQLSSLKRVECNQFLDDLSVKYVIVQLNGDTKESALSKVLNKRFYKFINPDNCNLVFKELYLTNLAVFENLDYRPKIYTSSRSMYQYETYTTIESKNNLSTRYEFEIKNVKEDFYLNFSERYNDKWSLRIGEFNSLDSIFSENYFLDSKNHSKTDLDLNKFYINPNEICKNFECKYNSDGSFDIKFTIYFKSEAVFNLGTYISIFIFILVSIIFIIINIKIKYKK